MRKINVLYTVWATNAGGAEMALLNQLTYTNFENIHPIIFAHEKKQGVLEEKFADLGVEILRLPFGRFRHPLKYIKHIKRIIIEKKVDIVHGVDDMNMLYGFLAAPKRIVKVAHSHSSFFETLQYPLMDKFYRAFAKSVIRKRADVRLACGQEAGEAMFGKKPFVVINNGIDTEKFRFDQQVRDRLRGELGIDGGDRVIIQIGRLSSNKNQLFSLDVLAEYKKHNNKAKLLLVGKGSDQTALEEKIAALGLGGSVKLLGERDDVDKLLQAADVMIMPSLYEGLPVTIIEAQASGVKCLASTNVTREVDKTGDVEFFPLEKSAKEWAERIAATDIRRHSDENIEKLKQCGYDARVSAQTAEEIYVTAVTCKTG